MVDTAMEAVLSDLTTYDGTLFPLEKQDIFSQSFELLSIGYLETLSQGSVPVAIMRSLLNIHRVLFDPNRCPSWMIYAKRYTGMV